jgi:hypothetical protein
MENTVVKVRLLRRPSLPPNEIYQGTVCQMFFNGDAVPSLVVFRSSVVLNGNGPQKVRFYKYAELRGPEFPWSGILDGVGRGFATDYPTAKNLSALKKAQRTRTKMVLSRAKWVWRKIKNILKGAVDEEVAAKSGH